MFVYYSCSPQPKTNTSVPSLLNAITVGSFSADVEIGTSSIEAPARSNALLREYWKM